MNLDTIKTFHTYHDWANDQVLACVAQLDETQYKQAQDYSIGSVENQIYHVMHSDWWAMHYLLNTLPDKNDPQTLKQTDYPTLAAIQERWPQIRQDVHAMLNDFTEATLTDPIKISAEQSIPKWQFMMAGINHGTNHRAQILALLGAYGAPTCEQGFYFYLLAQQQYPK